MSVLSELRETAEKLWGELHDIKEVLIEIREALHGKKEKPPRGASVSAKS